MEKDPDLEKAEYEQDMFDEYLELAKKFIEEKKPNESQQKKDAFTNSVPYVLLGISGGYGGPSVREHSSNILKRKKSNWTFEEVCTELIKDDGLIFGPIKNIHRIIFENEYCFDDDPEDIKRLEELEAYEELDDVLISWDYKYNDTLRLNFRNEIEDDSSLYDKINEAIVDSLGVDVNIDWRDSKEVEIHNVFEKGGEEDLVSKLKNIIKESKTSN